MPRRFPFFFLLVWTGLHAQTATDLNLGSKITVDTSTTPAAYTLSWWGKSERHYLVEATTDLVSWTMLNNINPTGNDAVLGVAFTATSTDKIFLRVIQFDPNDISALADSDTDGLPDKWERYYFGDLSRDGSGDWNNDGVLDRDAFRFGLDPKGADQSQVAGQADGFVYDARGWLNRVTLSGSPARTLTLDAEGNIQAHAAN